MNRKQFLILLALVIIVGVAGWLIHQRNQNSWQSAGVASGQKLLPNFPINDIAQIGIQSATNEMTLAKIGGVWRVRQRGNYPADFSQISDLLIKLADLKIVQSQDAAPSELAELDLLPPGNGTNSGTLVLFQDQNGKTLDSLLLGKKHLKSPAGSAQMGGMADDSWPDGRYVMVGSGAKTVAVISDSLDSVEANPAGWLGKDFLNIENPSAISVQFPQPTNSWKLTRLSETNDWQLADARPGEKLDPDAISDATTPFSSGSFDDVLPPNRDELSGLTNAMLTVETFDHLVYTARIGQEQNDDYPVTFSITTDLEQTPPKSKNKSLEDQQKAVDEKLAGEKQFENWIYLVPSYVIEPVLKNRSQLLEPVKKT